MTKKGIIYLALTILSFALLIYFIFCPKSYKLIEDTISTDNTEIYIVQEETYLLNKSISEWGVIISIIGLLFGTTLTCTEYISNKKKRQQEKGAEIAKVFSDELVHKCSILGDVIMHSSLKDLLQLEKINDNDIKNFDVTEIIELFKDKNIFSKYEQILKSDELDQLYFRELELRISSKNYSEVKNKIYTDEEAKKLFILDNSNLPFKFTTLLTEVLNKLENISMYISSQSASSIYIYQSLHQIFLKTIRILALSIAHSNETYSNKYYTNIIHVYNMWIKTLRKQQKREKKNKEKAYKKLNPKINTVQ